MKKIIIILAIVLVIGGLLYFLLGKKITGIGGGAEKALDELSIEALAIDMSLSPLPKLNISSFNLSSPQLPSSNIFSGFSINTNFSYTGDLNISAPSVQLNAPTIPSNIPSSQQPPSSQSTQPPAQEPSQGSVNSANCSAFASIPSSQYCSMAGSSGQTLCEQCKAAGY